MAFGRPFNANSDLPNRLAHDLPLADFDGATLFQPGDAVYYAGDITRSGANAAFHLVDERIVGHKPASLSHAEAAALPLTTITA